MDALLCFRAFLLVTEAGSFSEAARRAGVATSVIKKRVDQLEDHTHLALFTRTTRSITLTDAGRRHLQAIRRAVREMEDVLASVHKRPLRLHGHLKIKAPTTLTALYLGDMLNRFLELNPGITLDLVVLDRPVNPVMEGFDVAVGLAPGSFSGVTEIGLCESRRLVVATPAYLESRGRPITPLDLHAHDVLNFEPSGRSWSFEGPAGPILVDVEPRLTSNDGQQLLLAAMRGMGITRLSSYIVAAAIESGLLQTVLDEYRIQDFWIRLLIPDAKTKLEPVRALVAFLKSEFSPRPPWMNPASDSGNTPPPPGAA
ncbi:MAG: LysR family transcriptional regulator [Paraburkholderia tropica]|uniref:LysR family transcriptional regulator n=1 Tax=Paraburkholderia tropica TaxID=92647 RepID=A0ABX5MMH5_9BURK|nr:LysR family transcriptional regulator [Paraburkholderia tropica]PXX12529.1 LysR family transcriptional regulator [Paraburkholderia tropica]PZW76506.1 LysR family transcriptional regulator [Paraburkholderia tropica]